MEKFKYLIAAGMFFTLVLLIWPSKKPSSPSITSNSANFQREQGTVSTEADAEPRTTITPYSAGDASLEDSAPKKLSPEELEKIGWLEGRVVNPEGQGLEDARIGAIIPKSLVGTTQFSTNDAGYFRLPQPKSMPFSIHVSAKGYQGREVKFPLSDPNLENVIILEPGGYLTVQVRDEWGQPVPKVSLQSPYMDVQETDQNGSIQLYGLPDPINIMFKAEGYNFLQKTLPLNEGVQTVTLLENGVLFGRVLDDREGIPIQQFDIKRRENDFTLESYGFGNKDGAFDIIDLPRENQRFVFIASGYLPQILKPDMLDAKRQAKPVEIRLSDQGIFFEGTIRDKEQIPIANARVTAFIGEDIDSPTRPLNGLPSKKDNAWDLSFSRWIAAVETLSDTFGKFKIGPLPDNSFLSLSAEAKGFAPNFHYQVQTLIAAERLDYNIILEPFGIVKVHAGQESYPGIRRIRVDYENHAKKFLDLQPGETEIVLSESPPGRAFFRFYKNAQHAYEAGILAKLEPDSAHLEVVSGETHELELGMLKGLTLGGTVLLDGIPMVHKQVTVDKKRGISRDKFAKTDANGKFTIKNLKPGTYEVMSNGLDSSRFFGINNRREVLLETDQPDLVFEFQSMGSVFGRVLKEPENTPIMMKISFKTGEQSSHSSSDTTLLNKRGYFEFHQVPASIFSLFKVKPHPQQPEPLILDVTMPDDGSDLDLGDLGDREGILNLKLEAPNTLAQPKLRVYQVNADGEIRWNTPLAILSRKRPARTVEGLETGPLHLKTETIQGFRVEPSEYRLVLSKNEAALVSFKFIPETHFLIRLHIRHRQKKLMGGKLIEESTQKVWPLPSDRNARRRPDDFQKPFLYLDSYFTYGINLPEGWWQIQLLDEEDSVAIRRFQLMPGNPVSIVLKDQDFKNDE